jgi:uncharacterized protein YbjT (DUF2867 family)
MKILLTGATGFIGGRLVPRLLERGHQVRVLVRDPRRIGGHAWLKSVEVAVGDIKDRQAVEHALQGIDVAYYLVHAMSAGRHFADRDLEAASNFAAAARDVRHVIYLGGLLPHAQNVSAHLRSRAEVGRILREKCPTTEFRAGPIIGSGSASFEMVRYLTERLPAMIAPRWILNEVQPIAIRDILSYLLAALDKPPLGIVEVGADRLTFKQMMEIYAEVRGLKRIIIPVPVLAPTLAALWIGLVTPISNTLAVPLVQGIIHTVIADVSRAREVFPEIKPIPYRSAVSRAAERIQKDAVETRWTSALGNKVTYELSDHEGLIREIRTLCTSMPPEAVFKSFCSIGGDRGWLAWDWLWEIRGLLDKIAGGPGLRRGRRHPTDILPGEALDFWRVEAVEPARLLRLRAEMKVPGRAWLQWEAVPEGSGTRLVQTAMFAPRGFFGTIYWYSLYPFHRFIFSDLVRAIADGAKQSAGATKRA